MSVQTKGLAPGLWLAAAFLALCIVVWAALDWPAAAVVSFAAALAAIRLRRRQVAGNGAQMPASAGNGDAGGFDAAELADLDLARLTRNTFRRDLSLAAEHVHSIGWLLEIARQHQQPIPTSAFTNLELVSKHLFEMRRRIDPGGEEAAPDRKVSAVARRRELQTPPRLQPLSAGCHACPSDKSAPFD